MRSRLLLTTAIVAPMAALPKPAEAAPIVGFLPAIGIGTQALVGTGATLLTTLTASAALTGIGSFLLSPFGKLIIGFGLSALSNALFKPNIPSPSDRMVNYSQPIAYFDRLYGRARKGGPLAMTVFRGKRRHYGVLIAAHSTQGVVDWWLDKFVVATDASGNVQTDPILQGGKSYGNVRGHTGQAGQLVDSIWLSEVTEITSAHDFEGLSYAAAWAQKPGQEKYNEILPNGTEWQIAPVWDGNDQIRDPRDDSVGFSRNWALCVAHELETYWGLSLDDDMLAAEADACDVEVTDRDGVTGAKWELNGSIGDDMPMKDILAQMIAAADAFMWEKPDGTVGIHAGRWTEPTVTLGPEDFFSQQIAAGKVEPGVANEFIATYVEPEREWRESPSGVYVEDDTLRRIRREPALYMVTWHNQAARVLKRMAKIEHAEYRLAGTIGLKGYELIEQAGCGPRFARYVDPAAGYDFFIELASLKRRMDGVSFDIEAYSVVPSDFDFNAVSEEPQPPELTQLDDEEEVDELDDLQGANYGSGNLTPAIEWTWPEQDEIYSIKLRMRQVTAPVSEWQVVTLDPGTTSYIAAGLIEGETYEAQIKNYTVSSAGGAGGPDYQPEPPVQVVAAVVPPALTIDTVAAEPGRVRFTGRTPAWVLMGGVRIYRGAVGAAFEDADIVTAGTITVGSDTDFDVVAGDVTATDLLSNGDFADGSAWTAGTDWSIASGAASHVGGSAGNLVQGISVSEGDVCRVTFTLQNRTAGDVTPALQGSATNSGTGRSADGTYAETIVAPAAATAFRLDASAAFVGNVDDVSVVVDTVDCLYLGEADFWIVPVSDTGGAGAPQGPYTLQVR
ncbi:fibronectin type III domain-containing protein [Psychromarinibacter halotolerans]|uniref:Fibronectin type-III domain-containing protein n=1 Tax=Psychromarinibacter halotolerans TaxID=1775175 RepID=A0ABV7GZ91_9RHOB|nr:fibronectin type III domain-containing protein [Psychromarinibacter halotolerans]MDF0598996.1 fibronectin type III domain-containing protein [Psychromarinibacter halotolerans]